MNVGYPSEKEEMDILERTAKGSQEEVQPILTREDIVSIRENLNLIYFDSKIRKNIIDLICATRFPKEHGFPELQNLIEIGASPRATTGFPPACRAQAFFEGRNYVSASDIKNCGFAYS